MGGGRVRSPERTVKIARAELTTSLFVYRRLLGTVAACAILDSLMSIERHVKLFKYGRNQAVRIRREFELPGEDAVIRKEGGKTDYRSCSSQIAARRSGDIIAAGRGFSADFRAYSEPGRSVMRYLLDTNIVSDLVRNPQGKL